MSSSTFSNTDEYIAMFPAETQAALELVRATIKKAAPDAEEVISYQMPAYKLNGMLVYFAGYKQHIGFYPTAIGIESFKDKIGQFKWSKGAIQFPLNEPMPLELITEIVKFKVMWNEEHVKAKKKK